MAIYNSEIRLRMPFDAIRIFMAEMKERYNNLAYITSVVFKDVPEAERPAKGDVSYAEIEPLFLGSADDRLRLAVYCARDAELPYMNLERKGFFAIYCGMSRLTGVPLQWLIERGASARELDWLAAAGLAVPQGPELRYSGDDLALLVTLGASRTAGITPAMLPFAILGEYLQALRALVDIELRMFRAGVLARAAPGDVKRLATAATKLSERLVVLLRRKLLLPTLQRLIEESHAQNQPARHARSRSRVRRKPREHTRRRTGART